MATAAQKKRNKRILIGFGVGAALSATAYGIYRWNQKQSMAVPTALPGGGSVPASTQQAAIESDWKPDEVQSYGSRGRMVKAIQSALNTWLMNAGSTMRLQVDGIWGPKTENVVVELIGSNKVSYNQVKNKLSTM